MDSTDTDALIRMVASEGASEPPDAQQAIASTALNRANLTGESIGQIASDPSIYNGAGTPHFNINASDPTYQAVARNITPVLQNGPTTDATHFYAPKLVGRPDWAQGQGQQIGSQLFYSRPQDFAKNAPSDDDVRAAYFAQSGTRQVTPAPGGGVTDPATGVNYAPDPNNPGHYLGPAGQQFEPATEPTADDLDAVRRAYFASQGTPLSTGAPQDNLAQQALGGLATGAASTEHLIGNLFGMGDAESTANQAAAYALTKLAPQAASALAAFGNFVAQPAQTWQGELARTAGAMAPGALFGPEGDVGALAQLGGRAANVALPALTSTGAVQGARAIGAEPWEQQAAGFVGGLAGGGLAAGVNALASGAAPAGAYGLAGNLTARQAANAGRYVQNLIREPDAQALAAQQGGMAVTPADLAGSRGVVQAHAAATHVPEVAEATQALNQERGAGLQDAYANAFQNATGLDRDTLKGDFANQISAARQAMGPKYEAVRANQSVPMTPALQETMKRPVVQQAMARASVSLRNAGQDPTAVGLPDVVTASDGSPVALSPQMRAQLGLSDAQRPSPTLDALDRTKRALQGMVERDDTTGRVITDGPKGAANRDINTASADFTQALREARPDYGDVLDQAGDYMKQQDAFEKGAAHLFNGNVTPSVQAKYLASLTPAEADAYRAGMGSAVAQKLGTGNFNPTILAKNQWLQQKLVNGMGQSGPDFLDQAQQIARLRSNASKMDVSGGSITAPSRAASEEQQSVGVSPIRSALSQAATDFVGGALTGEGAQLLGVHGSPFVPIALGAGNVLRGALMRNRENVVNAISALGRNPETQAEIGRLLVNRGMTPQQLQEYINGTGISGTRPLVPPSVLSAGYLGSLAPANSGAGTTAP